MPVKIIFGITKLLYFEWPIEGPFIGYIQAQTLPHIGEWSHYSPTDISNPNLSYKMFAKDMVIKLNKLAEEGEIQKDEIPEIKTIEGWITRYSTSLRKESAE
ncbi:hypothetical protein C1645_820237 [Glomus cerebriforme]|uniref:Uncharacterized protein n=1 Tax=Glomus cerebriforme TaxID=658196 RepID=A0A397T3J9_9GLOM|nr:hypothetical protein C1645_820237 [Glomus cerebriforme]